MANDIVPNVIDGEKRMQNELNYFASTLCQTITVIEPLLLIAFPQNIQIELLLSLRDKWEERFSSMIQYV